MASQVECDDLNTSLRLGTMDCDVAMSHNIRHFHHNEPERLLLINPICKDCGCFSPKKNAAGAYHCKRCNSSNIIFLTFG